jgi:multiple sugar transport system substrate-binding protein
MPPEDIFINTSSPTPVPVTTPILQPVPQPVAQPLPQAAPQPPTHATVQSAPPSAKKGLPKIIFIVLGVILLLVAVFFAIKTFIIPKNTVSGQLTWWGLWEDSSAVQPLISAYESTHPGVKITYVKQSSQDYRERLTSSLAKGTGPDIFAFHNSWVPMFSSDLASMPTSVMNPVDYSNTFYKIASSDLTNGNSIVGIPLEYDALTLYVNEDIFKANNKTPPATWDDLRTLAKQLTIKNDQGQITQAGIALGRTENVDHWPEILALMMVQNGVDLSNPTGVNAEGALTFFTNFSKIDGVWDSTLPSSTQVFESGNLAMYIAPSWREFEIKQANPKLNFKTYPIPQLPKDNPSNPDITYSTYWAQGVWAKSTGKAAAWDFLKFLSTQDSLQKMFQTESLTRDFGEPYSRVDMSQLLTSHPLLGSIILQAPGATSWYLNSRTFDGPTGINSLMANYFGDAVNAVANGKSSATEALATCAKGVAQVLAQYHLTVK